MMDLDLNEIEIFYLRRKLYEEVYKVCQHGWQPEARDFEAVKKTMLAHIAYEVWEKVGKPTNNDIYMWLQAEEIWNFIRYMW
jgi:hypothetical protein